MALDVCFESTFEVRILSECPMHRRTPSMLGLQWRFSTSLGGHKVTSYLPGQWLNFKLFGITYLVGKIKFKLFFQGPRLSEVISRGPNNSTYRGEITPVKPIYFRPFIGVNPLTLFMTSRGPPCNSIVDE